MHHPGRRTFLSRFPLGLQAAGLIAAGSAAGTWPAMALARPAAPSQDAAPIIGVDPLLDISGVTQRWAAAMARDLGWQARWAVAPSGQLLRQLEQGQLDAAVCLSHPMAEALAQQGLVHGRAPLARTPVYLIGPVTDPAGLRGMDALAQALAQVMRAQEAGATRWAAPEPDSALAALAGRLLQGYPVQVGNGPARTVQGQAASSVPYALVTRVAWEAGGAPRGGARVWVAGADTESLTAEWMLPLRRRHPAARLLSQWIQGRMASEAWRRGTVGWVTIN